MYSICAHKNGIKENGGRAQGRQIYLDILKLFTAWKQETKEFLIFQG